jgi:hypothetical protein
MQISKPDGPAVLGVRQILRVQGTRIGVVNVHAKQAGA